MNDRNKLVDEDAERFRFLCLCADNPEGKENQTLNFVAATYCNPDESPSIQLRSAVDKAKEVLEDTAFFFLT